MLGDTTAPRRRKLPVLGMTTVGLAVGAGSLGLYRGTAAVPVGPPDQPTWTTAEVRSPAPPPLDEPIVQVAAQEPAPPLPAVPVLPALPSLPTIPSGKSPEPTPLPPLPRPVDVLPAPVPVTPTLPALPVVPAMPVPAIPDFVKAVEVKPIPVKAIEAELAPPPRQYSEPVAVEVKPLAPVAQPVQLAPPVRPIAPGLPDYHLPQSQPGFNVNSTPVVPSVKTAPGTLTPLVTEHPGETAVIPSYQALKAAALGMALAAAPVNAAETPSKIPAADSTKEAAKDDVVGDLKKLVEKLRQDVELEKKFRELTDDTVKGKLNKESGKTEPGLLTKFDELDARMKRLEEALKKVDVSKFEEAIARLETKLTDMNKTTTTQKPDATAKAMPGPVAVGPALFVSKATVRIVNEYPVPISMMVNGTSHRVEPSSSKTVEIPSGTYSYELLNAGSQATTATIKENDSVTLRIK
jgi:hypothetical protein